MSTGTARSAARARIVRQVVRKRLSQPDSREASKASRSGRGLADKAARTGSREGTPLPIRHIPEKFRVRVPEDGRRPSLGGSAAGRLPDKYLMEKIVAELNPTLALKELDKEEFVEHHKEQPDKDMIFKALIADDSTTIRRMIGASLEKAGFEVTRTINGRIAWDMDLMK